MLTFLQQISTFSLSSTRAFIATGKIILAVGLCVCSLLLFVYFAREIAETDFAQIDMKISMLVFSLRTPSMTSFMEFVSSFGDNICLALAGLVSVIFLMKKHRIEAVLFCLVLLMGLILNNTFKLLYQRPRPNISPLVVEHSYSFPSGHAMNSFIFYALLVYFSYHFFHKKSLTILMSIVAVVLVGMIGFSRVYLGVHYFTDVVAGYIAGFWWFITVLLIQHLLIFYKLYKSSE